LYNSQIIIQIFSILNHYEILLTTSNGKRDIYAMSIMISNLTLAGNRLSMARNMLGLSRRAFREKFDISVNTLQAWESGKNPLSSKNAKKISENFLKHGLFCSHDWLLEGNGSFPYFINSEILRKLPHENINQDKEIFLEIETFKNVNTDPVILTISDESMYPFYNIGDYVGGNKKLKEDISQLIGCNCIIETAEGYTLCRKLLKSESKNTYILLATNMELKESPIVITNVNINYAAEIIWHRKRGRLQREEHKL
jgi:DNA-binding transcriptional regulator YiaG